MTALDRARAAIASRAQTKTMTLPQGRTRPAPEASPVGAFAYFTTAAGQAAWLDVTGDEPVGYARTDATDPATGVRFEDVTEWTAAVEADGVGTEQPAPTEDPAGSAPPAPPAADDPVEEPPVADEADEDDVAGVDDGDQPTIFDDDGEAAQPSLDLDEDPDAAPPVEGKAGGPPISTGSYVSWGQQRGRVDMVVTSGKVPGVDDDVEGTTGSPAARVVLYEKDGDGWKATRRKAAAKVHVLRRTPPLTRTGGKDGADALIGMLTDHREAAAGDPAADVDGTTVLRVFERGVKAWPGEAVTTLTAQQWALGRVDTFLAVARREAPPAGFTRDVDLLPAGHPERRERP